jgi:glyoxylase-like metal-dependent hydrolase (beta-lactamase superfamily II)
MAKLSGAVLLAIAVIAAGTARADSAFRVETLSDGVLLFRPADSDRSKTNSLVVERDDGLLVVGAQPSPVAARELLAAIAEQTSSPVRYLVYDHAHAEAAGGGSAFPSATLVIASASCQDALNDPEYDFGAEMRAYAEDPSTWVEPERRLATLVAESLFRLDDSRQPVALFVLARPSHARGELVVELPRIDLTYAGSLLFTDRNPNAADGSVSAWINSLNHLIRDRPSFIVGLRGPVLDYKGLYPQRDSLAWLRDQVAQGFVAALSLNDIEDRVLRADGIEEQFAVDAQPSFFPTVIHQAVEEAAFHRRKRGRPVVEREPGLEENRPGDDPDP